MLIKVLLREIMNEATLEMHLGEYFFMSDDDLMKKIQELSKRKGAKDGTAVKVYLARDRWKVSLRLSWES